ncbi:MAG: CapA family protein [Clostridiaceae bacterium]|nr:CapA family protein [Clostridiaceae bacterium]
MKQSNVHQARVYRDGWNDKNRTGGKRRPRRRTSVSRLLALILLLALVLVLAIGQLVPDLWDGLSGTMAGLASTGTSRDQQSSLSALATPAASTAESTAAPTSLPTATPTPEPSPATKPDASVTLAAVGDIILHQKVIDGGLVSGGGNPVYDFNPDFQYVKPIIAAADLAMANYEGTLAGPPYSGYPFFCAPDAIADALYQTGFRVAWTANNHTIDKGLAGVVRTAQVFRERGFQVVGTRPDEQKSADGVVDVKGIKIGLMAYTFETTGTETQKTLNGNPMPAAADPLIDSFNPNRDTAFERDIAVMLERAEALRSQGAELICLSLHWGIEYQTKSNSFQRKMAQRLADAGIELIIGHHPHVLQEIDVLTSAKTGRPTLVFYSLSNFLHNMDYETHGSNGHAQDAVIARIKIARSQGLVSITGAEYIPTYVVRVSKGDQLQHLIVPVLLGLADPAAYQTTTREMTAARDRIAEVLGGSRGNDRIPVREADGSSAG